MRSTGTFDVRMTPEPAFDTHEGVSLARATVAKRFHGPLDATSTAHMLAAQTPVQGSAGYVAIERIDGTLDGKRGSFVVLHQGTMQGGTQSLSIVIAPDSGSGELKGIRGRMEIAIVDGVHHYVVDYELA